MTYNALERSVQRGDPVFRFLFITGDIEYRFTTEQAIVADSNGTYTPEAIRMGEVSQTNEMSKDPLKLEFPRDNTFAQNFLGGVPEQLTSVTVFRGHVGDTDEEFQFYWKGRVAGASASGDVVSIECENIFTSMRRPGLRARYQRGCRHPLYSAKCGVNDYDFAEPAVITGINGLTLTLQLGSADSSSNTAGFFTGGTLETAEGELRYITAHSGSTITLMYGLSSISEALADSDGSISVTLYPGCAHTTEDCLNKFNNIKNYGGFQAMPGKNPFANNVTGSIA